MEAPAVAAAASPVTRGRTSTAYWNSWLQGKLTGDVDPPLIPDLTLDVHFDLSAYPYSDVFRKELHPAIVVEPAFQGFLAGIHAKSLAVLAKPFVVGRGLELLPGQAKTQRLKIAMARLRTPPRPEPETEFIDFADAVNAVRASVGTRVTADPGCAGVGIALFTEDLQPLSFVTRTVAVGPRTQTGECAEGTEGGLSGGALELLAARSGHLADAALHLFEISIAGERRTVAVFVTNDTVREMLSWPIGRSLPEYFTGDLLGRLHSARSTGEYDPLAHELAQLIFPTSSDWTGDAPPDRAWRALRDLLRIPGPHEVVARLVDRTGRTVFLPFGLLEVDGKTLAESARVVQPLPRTAPHAPGGCIGPWTMVLPTALDAVDSVYLAPVEPAPSAPVTTWSGFAAYLTGSPAPPAPPEGLLVLSHHGRGRLTFWPNTHDSILCDNITRSFPVGSVAVLVACNVGQLSGDNDGLPLVSRLNENGVEAMVVSPFSVDAPLGARFALHFAHQVEAARRNGETPDLGELFDRARTAVQGDPLVATIADEADEFVLAGNAALRLCRP